ncbi:AAA family ATPase [Herbivorax sp. ANBcel31]|uniref:AAA family ATPase n=1 Tax=Herbivorax sp. ANBcel31 TaxID=3069754 RepID=UPI0027AF5CE1|nr:AAA family ATPase [Herbivorax sp. ANBcel31]MDQ2087909.1 AAA family ATPase [Herbivorax sp. ANBcel31]
MRISKIKLLNDYKLFKENQEFAFGTESIQGIVGINGSGKSILLELISRVFIEASNQITQEKYSSKIYFEVIYSLVKDHMINSVLVGIGGGWENVDRIIVRFCNNNNQFKMWISNGIEEYEVSNSNLYCVFLPRKIIVYSSGHNEGISDEIFNYKLYSLTEKDNQRLKRNNAGQIIDKGILYKYNEIFYYFNDSISKLAILTVFLYGSINQETMSQFLKRMKVKAFKLRLDKQDIYGEEIYFDEKARYLLTELEKIQHTNHINENGFEYLQYMIKDNEVREQSGLLAVFEGFQRLDDFNVYKIKKRTRSKIIHSSYENKKSFINWNIANNRVFELLEVIFKTEDNHDLNLRAFSDGEYQVLQIISILSIFNGSNNLFLLDEPETHFNPSWKSLFVSSISKMVDDNSQVIFTSHNPEVITDLRSTDVISMNKGIQKSLQLETFGANPNIISANLFDKKNTVAELAKQKIKEFRKRINESQRKEELEYLKREIESSLGDSSERLMLLLEIQKRMI